MKDSNMVQCLSLYLAVFFVFKTRGTKLPLASREVAFEDFEIKTKIPGHQLNKLFHSSKSLCATYSLKQPDCRSFGFCPPKTCVLYSGDVFSNISNTQRDENCDYLGMRKDDSPQCMERGGNRNIQNDDDPNFCAINLKRQDSEWTSWSEEETLSGIKFQFKKARLRECFPAAHGGFSQETCNGTQMQITRWLKFIPEKSGFDEAAKTCGESSGQLAQDFSGDPMQLDFYYPSLGNECFWIGVKTDDPLVWDIAGGQTSHSRLVWGDNQPGKATGKDRVVANVDENGNRLYLQTYSANGIACGAVCAIV